MVQKCAACGKFLKGGVVCPKCESTSHYECVRIPVDTIVPDSWRCGECQINTPKGRDPSTPVCVSRAYLDVQARARSEERLPQRERPLSKGMREDPMFLDDTAHNITAEFSEMELQLSAKSYKEELIEEIRRMQDGVSEELRSLKSEVRSLCTELKEVRREMSDFRVCVAGVSARMDGLEGRLDAVERQRAAEPEPRAVADLQATVCRLQRELAERDQDALLADLEIGHLPEERGESVLHAVTVLAAKLGVPLEERDVVFAERVGVAQGAAAAGQRVPPRRVVVRLARHDLRDRLLQGARVRRTLTAADAGAAPASAPDAARRIYVNERLTRGNRHLFYRVREECRRAQWRFAWTKRGRVYARQADGKPAYPIRSEDDVARVFGISPVG